MWQSLAHLYCAFCVCVCVCVDVHVVMVRALCVDMVLGVSRWCLGDQYHKEIRTHSKFVTAA